MGTLMRLASMNAKESRNENHRLVQVLFSQGDLEGSRFLTVEKSTYFPHGKSPIHAETHSEEIIYFRKGRGKVLRGNEYVEVGAGDAVTIPSGIEHHVVNSGTDVLDHILVSAECASSKCRIDHQPGPDDCVPPDQARQLTRLSCRRIVIGRNDSTPIAAFETAECIYAISSGHAIAHVRLSGTEYEWQYSLDSANCIWIPAGVPHFFRNIGDCPLQIVGFHSGLEA